MFYVGAVWVCVVCIIMCTWKWSNVIKRDTNIICPHGPNTDRMQRFYGKYCTLVETPVQWRLEQSAAVTAWALHD